jgi:uncharacterized protein
MEGKAKKVKKGRKRSLMNLIFPPRYDFYGMLSKQAEQTEVGVKALITWLETNANSDPVDVIREENKGDEIRLDMESELQGAFSTPFDRQDIYEVSRRMDHILNFSVSTAYEMKAFGVKPDTSILTMARSLSKGTELMANSVNLLKEDPKAAGDLIPKMRDHEREIEKTYVHNMAIVFEKDEPIIAMKKREIYHHLRDAGRHMSITVDVLHRIIVAQI